MHWLLFPLLLRVHPVLRTPLGFPLWSLTRSSKHQELRPPEMAPIRCPTKSLFQRRPKQPLAFIVWLLFWLFPHLYQCNTHRIMGIGWDISNFIPPLAQPRLKTGAKLHTVCPHILYFSVFITRCNVPYLATKPEYEHRKNPVTMVQKLTPSLVKHKPLVLPNTDYWSLTLALVEFWNFCTKENRD